MPKVQQLVSMDEIESALIGERWMSTLAMRLDKRPGTEITCREESVTTLWKDNRPIALVIRQRDALNFSVTTLVEI